MNLVIDAWSGIYIVHFSLPNIKIKQQEYKYKGEI